MITNDVENFVETMDTELPIFMNYLRLHEEAFNFGWDRKTMREVAQRIEQKYDEERKMIKAV